MKKEFLSLVSGVLIIIASLNVSLAQDTEPKYGADSARCIMNSSLYYEFYKQWKQSDYETEAWKDAIIPWRKVFIQCPKSSINVYLHGEKLIEEQIKNASNKTRKEGLIDTLMLLYDKRIKYFGKEGYVLCKKGVDLYKLRPDAYEESYNILEKGVKLEGNEASGESLIYYFRSAEKMVKAEKAEKVVLVDIYDQVSEIIDFNIKSYESKKKSKKVATWNNVKGNIELSFEPWATCKDLIEIFTKKFEEDPNNIDLLKKITKTLDKKNEKECTESDLFINATENLHQLEPTAKSAELMGKLYINKEEYEKALQYLKEAADLYEDGNDKADVYFIIAKVYFQKKNYPASRSNCYEAIKLRPNDGAPYMLIGDMYLATVKQCGGNDLSDKANFWVAVDKFNKAKQVDPSLADQANKKIRDYSVYFPATETLFFYDLAVGDSYTVECWINETTTVRSSD
jgi:tetratricopeptide (TPR) repeat protein